MMFITLLLVCIAVCIAGSIGVQHSNNYENKWGAMLLGGAIGTAFVLCTGGLVSLIRIIF